MQAERSLFVDHQITEIKWGQQHHHRQRRSRRERRPNEKISTSVHLSSPNLLMIAMRWFQICQIHISEHFLGNDRRITMTIKIMVMMTMMITLRVDCLVDYLPSLKLFWHDLTLVFPHLTINMINDHDNSLSIVLITISIGISHVRIYLQPSKWSMTISLWSFF